MKTHTLLVNNRYKVETGSPFTWQGRRYKTLNIERKIETDNRKKKKKKNAVYYGKTLRFPLVAKTPEYNPGFICQAQSVVLAGCQPLRELPKLYKHVLRKDAQTEIDS